MNYLDIIPMIILLAFAVWVIVDERRDEVDNGTGY